MSANPSTAEPELLAVAETLREVRVLLACCSDSPQVRAVRNRLFTFEQLVAAWSTLPPSPARRTATLECLEELRAKVKTLGVERRTPSRTTTRRVMAVVGKR